jgi:hypothetical protein
MPLNPSGLKIQKQLIEFTLLHHRKRAGMLLKNEVLAIVVIDTGYSEVGLKGSFPLELHAM